MSINRHSLYAMCMVFVLSCLGFSQDVTLSIDGNNLNYVSSSAIGGFQFSHDGCAQGSSGGDAAANSCNAQNNVIVPLEAVVTLVN